MDHIVALIRGGKSSRANTVPACKLCNSRKKYLLPIEWDQYLHGMTKCPPRKAAVPMKAVLSYQKKPKSEV